MKLAPLLSATLPGANTGVVDVELAGYGDGSGEHRVGAGGDGQGTCLTAAGDDLGGRRARIGADGDRIAAARRGHGRGAGNRVRSSSLLLVQAPPLALFQI